jgi:hypothetical protein
METKRVKKQNEHKIRVELEELEQLVPLVVEYQDLLKQLGCDSIGEFELKVNERTKFTNALMSATAFGHDEEYTRLLELEKLIDGRLYPTDLTPSKELKSYVTKIIREKHTEYYTDDDLKLKDTLDKIIKMHNSLEPSDRKNIGYNRTGELVFSPFSILNI